MRPLWIRSIERASVAVFVLAWAIVGWSLGRTTPGMQLVCLVLVALPISLLLADFASGLVHWFADRYFDPATPVLGPMLIEPFREHHRDPVAMVHHDFFEICGNNGLVTLPLAAAMLALGPQPAEPLALQWLRVVGLIFALAIFATNLLHAWAHSPAPPSFVRRLQEIGAVLAPEVHARHHASGHDQAYCVTTGWLNPVLDRLGLFDALESLLARAGLETMVDCEGSTD